MARSAHFSSTARASENSEPIAPHTRFHASARARPGFPCAPRNQRPAPQAEMAMARWPMATLLSSVAPIGCHPSDVRGMLPSELSADPARCYWGHGMPVLGTPRLKIQVIDLGRSKQYRRAQMQWAPSPMHTRAPVLFDRPRTMRNRHPPSCQLPAAGWPGARAGWLAACMNSHSVSEFWIMHA